MEYSYAQIIPNELFCKVKGAVIVYPISKAWKLDLLREIVVPEDIPLIQNLKSTLSPRVNRYCWSHTKSGVYSVKSGYALAMETMEASEPAPVLEPSATALQARALSNCVPVCNSLADRHCGNDRNCPRCGAEEETRNHLFFECPSSVQAWDLADMPHSLAYSRAPRYLDTTINNVPWVIWYIWKARNDKAFNSKDPSPLETIQIAKSEAESWRVA
ncbi:uncharacterized protein LOC106408525 [Brassica napus]|uniref:uncharacterized protein LOC106408525 n=1 Tax=Brassica napus TaxID=3708 RepID=UPI002078C4E9|nr:uncharacterized protein LOC106408525 [Brassica napus]